MSSPADLKYTKEHEWVRVEGSPSTGSPSETSESARRTGQAVGTIGITDYAQDQLGDIVYLDLPAVGAQIRQMEKFGEIESVKAVSELFSPVSGEVLEVNAALAGKPELVNGSPYGEGWMMRVRLSDLSELGGLLSAQEYDDYIAQGAG